MTTFQIITDSACDLPAAKLEAMNIHAVPLCLNFRGQLLADRVDDSIQELYAALRSGEAASTSAVNPEGWKSIIIPALQEGRDVLVLAFSSGLSTTCQSAVIAAEELKEEYPDRRIIVVDGLCASLGQGLLLHYLCKKRDEGATLEETAAWAEDHKLNLAHWFTVDDLMYLKRGGRVSAVTALVGTMLNIKPVLHVDDEGHLINVSKARGRKASIRALADSISQSGTLTAEDPIYICHGDCIEDAEYLKKLVLEQYGQREVFIGYTGAVIGSHSGPGTLAIFFLARNRD